MIKVLDSGFVDLVDSMGNDLTVVNSARVSFGKRKSVIDKSDRRLIKYLAEHKHYSPFRHVQFQLHCKVPEFVARNWFKHQVGCGYTSTNAFESTVWNEISGRYVDMSQVEFYIPGAWRKQSEDNKQASDGKIEDSDISLSLGLQYSGYLDITRKLYREMVEVGVAKEQARMVLPLSFYTEFYWTASLQAVVNFINLRDHPGAQWEIQQYAKAIKSLIGSRCPLSLEALCECK